ncbi:type II secretion system F family protein [Vibrio mangrovi]|uniref:Putative type II secretion system protein F n=1 Tax=Vibrio mangrovi TaxID=474394 RepID=A0A1Y6IUA7_9VIBR|nr:type II secretion system F family protein [Vibrio mangrovi]MDW6002993.1 type II secretion system F family protein [Vibrio mangrovi]SMS01234.1 Putative type II secretion system protein F [Vibrio mangrovi]
MPRPVPELQRYYWKGNRTDQQRRSGHVWAFSQEEAFRQLQQNLTSIHLIRPNPPTRLTRFLNRARSQDITHIIQQLAIMLNAGLPIVQALLLIATQFPRFGGKVILLYTHHALMNGSSVTDALKQSSSAFHGLYGDMLHAGEMSGKIAETLAQIADYREKKALLRAKILKAATYPLIVLLSAVSLTILMLTKVIPEFAGMFQHMHAELPWLTRQVLNLAGLLQIWGTRIIWFTATSIFLLKTFSHRFILIPSVTDILLLKIPLFGTLRTKAIMIRCCRTLATCYDCGIPLLDSLKSARNIAGSLVYQTALENILEQVSAGSSLHAAIQNSHCFPEFVTQMVLIGEESGTLGQVLTKVATQYEHDVDQLIEQLGELLEPLLILLLGGLVGGLVIAMYLPVFNLMQVMG